MDRNDAKKKLCPFIQEQVWSEDSYMGMGPLRHARCHTTDCMAWDWESPESEEDLTGYCQLIERRNS